MLSVSRVLIALAIGLAVSTVRIAPGAADSYPSGDALLPPTLLGSGWELIGSYRDLYPGPGPAAVLDRAYYGGPAGDRVTIYLFGSASTETVFTYSGVADLMQRYLEFSDLASLIQPHQSSFLDTTYPDNPCDYVISTSINVRKYALLYDESVTGCFVAPRLFVLVHMQTASTIARNLSAPDIFDDDVLRAFFGQSAVQNFIKTMKG